MLFHFIDDTCSPKVLFIDENTDSTIQRIPYLCFFFQRFMSLNCSNTDNFRGIQLMLFLMEEFFLTFIPGVIFNSSRYLKFSLESFHHERFLLLLPWKLFSLSLCLLRHEFL